jgi:hypothetical protein
VSTTKVANATAGGALALTPPAQDSSTIARATSKTPTVTQTESATSSRRDTERASARIAARTPDEGRTAATVTPAGVAASAPAAPTPTDRAATPSRLANVNIAIPTVAADLRSLPSGLVVAIQTRAANGKESAEQGAYVSAREAFHGALKQLDSVAAAYPRSLQLESLRRDIAQMDDQTAQACRAENDVRQKRGGKPIPCS